MERVVITAAASGAWGDGFVRIQPSPEVTVCLLAPVIGDL